MILLKLGDRYINFDLVRHVEMDERYGVRIFFSKDDAGIEPFELSGDEASALKRWLSLHSTDVMPLPKNWRHTLPRVK